MNKEKDHISIKYEALQTILSGYEAVAVAFSAGVDSTLLLYAAKKVCKNVLAITAKVSAMPLTELIEAEEFCRVNGIEHVVLDIDMFGIEGFSENPKDRCYICKKAIFEQIISRAKEKGLEVVAEGTNADDVKAYRPGYKALEELGVQRPLKEAGLTKSDIRALARELGLSVADKPSAACLATRIPYGEEITAEKLKKLEEAEAFLKGLGLDQLRVRLHGDIARIEVPLQDVNIITADKNRAMITDEFHRLGFTYVTMDLDGFRSGSMDEAVTHK